MNGAPGYLVVLAFVLTACSGQAVGSTITPSLAATSVPPPTVAPTVTSLPPTVMLTATPSIPTIGVGGLQIPDPKVSNPEYFDLERAASACWQFARAMKPIGIEVTERQIAEALKDSNNYSVKANAAGEQYVRWAMTVSKDGIGYSLMLVFDGETGQWREATLLDSGKPIGLSLNKDDTQNDYDTLVRGNASYIFTGSAVCSTNASHTNVTTSQYIKNVQALASNINQPFWMAAFDPHSSYPCVNPSGLPTTKAKEQFVNDRLSFLLSLIKKGQAATLVLVNEANTAHQGGLDPHLVLYDLYGRQELSEIYVKAYRMAQGMDVGNDVRFAISQNLVLGNVFEDVTLQTLDRTINEISGKLGIPRDHVQLDFAGQLRIDFDGGARRAPMVADLTRAIDRFRRILGPHNRLFVTEIRVANTTAPEEIVRTLDPLLQATIATGEVDAFVFESPFNVSNDKGYNQDNIMLFDKLNHKAMFYYYLLSLLNK